MDDTGVSRQHCRIRQLSNEDSHTVFVLHDLASMNPVKINGVEIVKHVLEHNDEITVGKTVLVFKLAPAAVIDTWLVVRQGPRTGKVYPLYAKVTTIGRGIDCDIVLDDTGISKRHCEIHQDNKSRFTLYDLDTTYGTKVNSLNVKKSKLMDGDVITIGRAVLIVKEVTS